MEQVFLARHGETEWNRTRRRQGQLNSPLTRGALAQATVIDDGYRAAFWTPR